MCSLTHGVGYEHRAPLIPSKAIAKHSPDAPGGWSLTSQQYQEIKTLVTALNLTFPLCHEVGTQRREESLEQRGTSMSSVAEECFAALRLVDAQGVREVCARRVPQDRLDCACAMLRLGPEDRATAWCVSSCCDSIKETERTKWEMESEWACGKNGGEGAPGEGCWCHEMGELATVSAADEGQQSWEEKWRILGCEEAMREWPFLTEACLIFSSPPPCLHSTPVFFSIFWNVCVLHLS